MKDATRDRAATAFAMPEGIRCVMIDGATGLRAREDDWDAPLECFKEGSEPQAFAPMWQPEPPVPTEAEIPEGSPPSAGGGLTGAVLPAEAVAAPAFDPVPRAQPAAPGFDSAAPPSPHAVDAPNPASVTTPRPPLPTAEGASAPIDDEATPPQPMFQ
jgi:hypothetical protein